MPRLRPLWGVCARRRFGYDCGVARSIETVEEILDLCRQGRARDALEPARTLSRHQPGEARVWAAYGEAALRNGEVAEAVAARRHAVELVPRSALAHFFLGETLQFTAEAGAAEVHFHEAARLQPRRFVRPYRVGAQEFDEIAENVVATLPGDLADVLERRGTSIVAKPLPAMEMIVEDGLDPHALGYHFSNPFGLAGTWSLDGNPDAVEIYQLTIENWCGDETALRDEVRRTVLHEIGHAFGMDHDLLHQAGY